MFGRHLVILQMLLNPAGILWSCQIFHFSYLAVTKIQLNGLKKVGIHVIGSHIAAKS